VVEGQEEGEESNSQNWIVRGSMKYSRRSALVHEADGYVTSQNILKLKKCQSDLGNGEKRSRRGGGFHQLLRFVGYTPALSLQSF
jgi:hypothetical protein